MVIRHSPLDIPNHGVLRLLVQLDMIRVDSVDRATTIGTRVLEGGIHVHEGLVDRSGASLVMLKSAS